MNAARAFYLPATPGQRYCIFHPAKGTLRGCVVYAHPFAEELNKTRRMAAVQARAMAQAGFSVLQIDLLGCGDSSGDFGDARWSAWVADLLLACRWLREHTGHNPAVPLWLWGLRSGCLLAAQAARELTSPCNLLLWQPVASGAVQLQQFMRLRLAADLMAGAAKGAMDAMRAQHARGEPVEIAGYVLAPALAQGLEDARLDPPAPAAAASRLVVMELGRQAAATPSPAATRTLSAWQQAGWKTDAVCMEGPAFWQSTEMEQAPELLAATLRALATHD